MEREVKATQTAADDIEARLSASEARYQAFIRNSIDGIWRFEMEHPVPTSLPASTQIEHFFKYAYLAECNDALARMYGLKNASQLIGARLADFMDPDSEQNMDYLTAFIDSGYNLQGTESEEKDIHGNRKYFLNSLVGFVEDDKLVRAWGTQLDVTRQHNTNVDFQRSQERLDLALKVSKVGLWEWDILTGQLTWSDELRKLFHFPLEEAITYDKYVAMLHPDDRKRLQKTIYKSMKDGKPYEVEHRVVWPDGEVHWMIGRGQAILKNGQPVRMIGTVMNIDIRKSAEELKVRNALLDAEHDEMVRISKSKDEFIALASHQLRTPATAVKQFLGMLLEGYAGDLNITAEQKHLLQTAYESNERQIATINDLLMVAIIDAGKVTLDKSPTDIVSFVQDIVEELQPKYAIRDQKVSCEWSGRKLWVIIDSDRLRMALENLLDNASKYSPEGTSTTVSVKRFRSNVDIAIKDQGVGIAKADFGKLFQKFSRIDNPLSMVSGGSGLGLYWAQKIIELHGGSLSVHSIVGKGSTFTVSLPYEKPTVRPSTKK